MISLQAKLSIFLGFIIVFFSIIDNIRSELLILQILAVYAISRNIDCMVIGKCIFSSWIGLIIPIFAFLLTLLNRLDYFEDTRNYVYNAYNKLLNFNINKCTRSNLITIHYNQNKNES